MIPRLYEYMLRWHVLSLTLSEYYVDLAYISDYKEL
jgi:hypothetical protein